MGPKGFCQVEKQMKFTINIISFQGLNIPLTGRGLERDNPLPGM
jgi:hypothetical protein